MPEQSVTLTAAPASLSLLWSEYASSQSRANAERERRWCAEQSRDRAHLLLASCLSFMRQTREWTALEQAELARNIADQLGA